MYIWYYITLLFMYHAFILLCQEWRNKDVQLINQRDNANILMNVRGRLVYYLIPRLTNICLGKDNKTKCIIN